MLNYYKNKRVNLISDVIYKIELYATLITKYRIYFFGIYSKISQI